MAGLRASYGTVETAVTALEDRPPPQGLSVLHQSNWEDWEGGFYKLRVLVSPNGTSRKAGMGPWAGGRTPVAHPKCPRTGCLAFISSGSFPRPYLQGFSSPEQPPSEDQ